MVANVLIYHCLFKNSPFLFKNMNRLLFLPALMLVLFSSCKKDEDTASIPFPDDNPALKKELQGNWTNYAKVSEFYNLDGEVVQKDSAAVKVLHEFKENTMNISYQEGEQVASLNYSLPDTSASDKDYIVFLKNGQVQDYYQITSFGDSTMVWEMVVDWAGYKDASGNTVTSRKGVYTYSFKRD